MATNPDGGSGPAKRISFLVPYIDFSFMLIIIFIGMLAIATFEPLGSTQLETKRDVSPEGLAGDYESAKRGAPGGFAPADPGDARGVGVPSPEEIAPLLEKKGREAGLSPEEKAELEALRAEVKKLQLELGRDGLGAEGGPNKAKTGESTAPGRKTGGGEVDRPGPDSGGDPGRFDVPDPAAEGKLPGGKKETRPQKPGGTEEGDTLPGEIDEGPDKGPHGEIGGPQSADEGGQASGKHYFLDLRK